MDKPGITKTNQPQLFTAVFSTIMAIWMFLKT